MCFTCKLYSKMRQLFQKNLENVLLGSLAPSRVPGIYMGIINTCQMETLKLQRKQRAKIRKPKKRKSKRCQTHPSTREETMSMESSFSR